MLRTVILVYLVSFLVTPFLLFDIYMYPICRQCGDNLNSKRLGLMVAAARCRRHSDFVIT